MKRNPLYVFKDLNAVGINSVPLESMVQVNDADDLTPGSQPLLVQVTAKNGIVDSSTIRDFLADEDNYNNSSDTTEVHSELELIEQSGKQGWRLLGVDQTNYGNIGVKAVDFSMADAGSFGVPNGATGDNSFAVGYRSQAQNSFSTSIGFGTIANKDSMVVVGRFNSATNNDSQFEVGIGTTDAARRTGFAVNTDGTVETPSVDNILIELRGAKALVTKEYVNQADDLKVNKTGDVMTGSLIIEGNDITATKDLAGFAGNVYAENTVRIGVDSNSKSRVAFNNNNGQNIYYDNARLGFFVDVTSNEGFKLWHGGNQGINSGLDADLLDGLQPNELPLSDVAQMHLNLKFDKVGGIISGNTTVQANMEVQGTSILTGNVSITNVITPINFQENVHSLREVLAEGLITSSTGFKVGKDGTGSSSVTFSDTVDPLAKPKFYWENVSREFRIDTAVSNGHRVWHMGNFNPDTKLDIAGGTISGNLGVQGTLDIGGVSTFLSNVIMQGSLAVQNGLSIAGSLISSGALTSEGAFTALSTSSFTGAIQALSTFNATGSITTGDSLTVLGHATLNGGITAVGSASITGPLSVDGIVQTTNRIEAGGDISTSGILHVGIDVNSNSKILFTDQPTGESPSFFWDKNVREFHVDGDENTVGGSYHIWHAGNFDPLDTAGIPQAFDHLNDTPAGKAGAANKFLAVTTDELNIEYVNIPDISALWGNVTGDINNQADLITKFAEKFDKTGGTINGLLEVNGASTFNAPVVTNNGFEANGTSVFALGADVTFEDIVTINGLSTFASEATFNGLVDANGGLEVLGTSHFTGDVTVTADATINQTLTALNATVGNSVTVGNTLHVNLTSNLDGVINAGSTLTVQGATTLNNTLDVIGATDISGAVRVFNTLSVSQNALFQLDATVGQDLTVGQDVSIAGNTTIVGSMISGSAVVNGNLTTAVSGVTTINGLAYLNGATTIDDNLTVVQNIDVGGTVTVTGATQLNNSLGVVGNTTLSNVGITGTLDIIGNTSLVGTFNATEASSFGSTLNILGLTTIDGLLANQSAQFQDTLNVDGTITGASNLDILGTITQSGDAVATIDSGTGKIYTNQIPSIAITNVYVVADIIARDALTVEVGDVAKVTDSGDGEPQTYIFDGTIWIDIQETSDVISVNGLRGSVVLTSTDISEGSNLYYTSARAQADADVQIAAASIGDLSDVDITSVAPVTGQVLRYDGTLWIAGDDVDTTYAEVTATTGGVLTDAQAVKFDAIEDGAQVNLDPLGGTTIGRPIDPLMYTMYFDTDIVPARPVWCSDNTNAANLWVDATGTLV